LFFKSWWMSCLTCYTELLPFVSQLFKTMSQLGNIFLPFDSFASQVKDSSCTLVSISIDIPVPLRLIESAELIPLRLISASKWVILRVQMIMSMRRGFEAMMHWVATPLRVCHLLSLIIDCIVHQPVFYPLLWSIMLTKPIFEFTI